MGIRSLLFFLLWLGVGIATLMLILPDLHQARMAGGDTSSRYDDMAACEACEEAPCPCAPTEEPEGYAKAAADAPAAPQTSAAPAGDDDRYAVGEMAESASPQPPAEGAATSDEGEQWIEGPSFTGRAGAAVTKKSFQTAPIGDGGAGDEGVYNRLAENAASDDQNDRFAEIDRRLDNLPLGTIAFNTPETIRYGDMATIELLVSLREAEEELKRAIRPSGPVETARISVSPRMEARLSGAGFKVEAATPEVQALSGRERTQWLWQIEPTKTETLELHLTLSALLTVDGDPMVRAVRTFERTIVVNVPLETRLATFFSDHSEWLLPGILLPLVGALYQRYRKRRKEPAREADAPLREAA